MLVDGMSISAADYVPATLRDNGRVVLFGARTSGAGGDQRHVGLDDACTEATRSRLFLPCAPDEAIAAMKTLGFSGFNYTVTLGVRPDGRVIENVGVAPDVPYRIRAEDLSSGFAPMRAAVLDTLDDAVQAAHSVAPALTRVNATISPMLSRSADQ
jgi:C-terminal processing protease CtpA/Prc